jgi:hypothetical protein
MTRKEILLQFIISPSCMDIQCWGGITQEGTCPFSAVDTSTDVCCVTGKSTTIRKLLQREAIRLFIKEFGKDELFEVLL